jgi:hypothetical protein
MKKDQLEAKRRQVQSESSIVELQGKVDVTAVRCQRAEKLAAYVEAQLKMLKPNTILDYKLVKDTEPSSQLIAAMLVKEPIKNKLDLSQSDLNLPETPAKRVSAMAKRTR